MYMQSVKRLAQPHNSETLIGSMTQTSQIGIQPNDNFHYALNTVHIYSRLTWSAFFSSHLRTVCNATHEASYIG